MWCPFCRKDCGEAWVAWLVVAGFAAGCGAAFVALVAVAVSS